MSYIRPGEELSITAHVYRSEGKKGVAALIALSMDELKRMEQASMEKEEAAFQSICELLPSWTEQARETVCIRAAMEYLKICPVTHTSNEWKMFDTFRHERSNMVYKMIWWVNERTEYDRGLQKSVPVSWDLRWYVCYNTVQNPDKTGSGWQIAGQDSKVFKDKVAMDKYLQGRIAAYDHLFQEISPTIPQGEEGRFSVNGVLLPGYSTELSIDDLLDCLDEADTLAPSPPSPSASKKPTPHKHKKHTPTR